MANTFVLLNVKLIEKMNVNLVIVLNAELKCYLKSWDSGDLVGFLEFLNDYYLVSAEIDLSVVLSDWVGDVVD